ncbi:MAG: sortase and related acyltransferase [Parachlamydiales bacterium]|nr:sortase and related acyltransferase [Parachlamydiales bacterium]
MNFITLSLMGAAFLLIMFGAEGLYRFTKVPPEWTRKLQHVLSGLLAACFPWIFSSPREVAALGVIMAVVLLVFRKSGFLTSLHEVKRRTFGEFYFLLSAVALSILSWNNPPFYFIPMLTLTLSDTVAAIVGTTYKRVTYSIKGHVKSLEGSTAFFVVTLLTVHLPLLFLSDIAPLSSILIALNTALLVTLVEAVCRNGRDNILIPLSTYCLLIHFTHASQTLLFLELAIALGAGIIALVGLKNRSLSIDSFSPEDTRNASLESIHPEAICLLARRKNTPLASLSIQKKGAVGLIGHYEATCQKAGVHLLKKAQEMLAALGVTQIIGPMNGNTWHRYRLALDDSNPFFLGEPKNPRAYCEHFISAGFSIAEKYESRIVTNLLERKEAYWKLNARMVKCGIVTQSLKLEHFESGLKEIYEMSLPAFKENRFYEPIPFKEFSAIYQKMRPLLDPDFIQMAYDKEKRLIGYAFAYADAHDPSRLIFKTLATDKRVRANGLGVYLFDRMHWIAAEKGKKAVIHALMHSEHPSVKLSKSMNSQLFRSYVLYNFHNP